jgi:hypothetical protein
MTGRTKAAAAAAILAVGAALAASTAGAGPPGRWTQISHFPARVGLARAKDGTLHVIWAGPGKLPFSAVYDTPVSPSGAVGGTRPLLSGWKAVNAPTAAAAPDGSIHVLVSGAKTESQQDPTAGLNELVGPGAWQLGAHAFGSNTNASNADVRAAFSKDGRLVSAWLSAGQLYYQVGTDPATQPQPAAPVGQAANPSLVVDEKSGEAVVAYRGPRGLDYFRRILPGLGAPQPIGKGNVDWPQIAARAGGGVYGAVLHIPDWTKVWLVRFGGPAKRVPLPKGAQVFWAGVAAGPEGRLWVYCGDKQRLYVTRTNRSVTAYEPVQTLSLPGQIGGAAVLEGEGSSGPLDLIAEMTFYSAKDGAWHTQVWPALSLAVAKKTVQKGVQLTVRALDAGEPVAGVKIGGLPGGAKTTDAKGMVVVTLPAGTKGALSLSATKAGYVAATGKVSL